VKAFLERDGFYVIRSAGSHGVADLVAVRVGEVLFIQCKANGRLSADERMRLTDAAQRAGAIPVLASKDGRRLVMHRLSGEPVQKSTSGANTI